MARISPARAHFMRTVAAAQQASVATVTSAHANEYELMLAKLAEDRRRLKQVQSVERKIEVKRELLPDYLPWIEGVLHGDRGTQDDVFMTGLVWSIDVGDFAHALPMAAHALKHKLTLPDHYKRTTACLIAEEIAEYAAKARKAGGTTAIEPLAEALHLTAGHDMPDEVRAKLHKEIGLALVAVDPPNAHAQLVRAYELDKRVGVVKEIEKLERELKNANPAGTGEG